MKSQNTKEYLNSIRLKEKPSLTFDDLKKIKISPEQGPSLFYSIDIAFNNEGSKKLSILSYNNIYKPLVIVVDKKIITAPFVMDVINDGSMILSGNISYNEAKKIIDYIKKQ